MPFTAEKLSVPGVILVRAARFEDARGYFMETWSRHAFRAMGIAADFVQENQSLSAARNTLRGLHFQRPPHEQAKLVRVLSGSILDVAVDMRRSSASYLRWCAVTLAAGDGRQVFIPRGFAHGFLSLQENTLVSYLVDAPYAPALEGGVRWNDARIGIQWPAREDEVVLSDRDRYLPGPE